MTAFGPEAIGLVLVAAATATWWLTGMLIARLAERGLVDVPDGRRQNHAPTPRGAGLAFVALWAVLVIGWLGMVHWPWIGATLAIAAVGFLDDLRDVPVAVRLAVQVTAAILVVWVGYPGSALLAVAAVVFVVACTNAFNFMDGSNGLAATQSMFAAGALGLGLGAAGEVELALAAVTLVAVLVGFLPRNFPRASAFMGDVGSTFLGFTIAALGVLGVARQAIPIGFVLLCCATFLADTGLTLILRIRDGERWYTAHRRHSYQRLIDSGWSHSAVVGGFAAVNAVLVIPAMVLVLTGMAPQGITTTLVFFILATIWWWSRHGD